MNTSVANVPKAISALDVNLAPQDSTVYQKCKVTSLFEYSYKSNNYFPGDFCKPCRCSGNIDSRDPQSCESTTGKCLRCLNNTFGEACALCAPGYFGDAVERKDCQSCLCDKLGTARCDHATGLCVCKPNVIGEKCDRCVEEHYGFQSGQGCVMCDCAEASDSRECDDATGQCRCKPGVTGRSCNKCVAGYWNYTGEGCVCT